MTTSQQYTITPLGPIINLSQLVDVTVQARPLDDLYKNETYVGVIDEVKVNRFGTFAHFKGEGLNLAKWIKIDRIDGYAHLPTPTPAAAADQPTAEVAVIETPVIAAETPVAAQPAHMTDTGRFSGTVGSVYAGYGYINETGGGSIRFLTRNVLAGVTLQKGMAVTYTTGAYTDCALTIVVTGNHASEEAYTRVMDRKATEAAAKQPAKDRAALRKARYAADLAARAAKDKASMKAAMDTVLGVQ